MVVLFVQQDCKLVCLEVMMAESLIYRNSKICIINGAVIAIIFCIFLANEVTLAENNRQRSTKLGGNGNDEHFKSDGDLDLLGLSVDIWENEAEEYHGKTVKRVERSPFDEDIDEKENSEEDDEEEDDETNPTDEKAKTPNATTTSAPEKNGEMFLPKNYNNLVIPKLNFGEGSDSDESIPVPVYVFLNIRTVRDIDEPMETLTLDLDLVVEWYDFINFGLSEKRHTDITLNPIFLKKVWRPDIYIDEIVKVKRTSLMNKPLKLKFNPSTGHFSYTTRLTVQLSCDMWYFYYPADTHRCKFKFRSYSYFSKDMTLSWYDKGVYLQDPFESNFDLQVKSVDRSKLSQSFRNDTDDTYDCLTFTIIARRKLSFHLVQTYLPSLFFIVITWLCFLIPSRMVEVRIGICMTTLLTLTSMFASVRASTPLVSYVKAIDTWMVFCIFFVFRTLLEFSTFVWLRARREAAEEQKLDYHRKLQEKCDTGHKDPNVSFVRSPSLESIQLRKFERFAEFTEKFAFIIFSIVFTSFNVIYWTWLLVASDYFNWSVNETLNADLD